jgi:hypothetical protein
LSWTREPWAETTAVGRILAALDRLSLWPSDISCLVALLALHHVKLHLLTITHAAQVLARIVLDNGSLMNKHILLGVIPINKAISILHVEPLHSTGYFGSYDFLFHLLHLLFNILFPCRFGLGHGS